MSKLAVCVLIVDQKSCNFLSVSLKDDHTDFNLPGGKVELGENIIDAGVREVKEETGIDVFNLEFLYGFFNIFLYFEINILNSNLFISGKNFIGFIGRAIFLVE